MSPDATPQGAMLAIAHATLRAVREAVADWGPRKGWTDEQTDLARAMLGVARAAQDRADPMAWAQGRAYTIAVLG